MNRYAEGNLCRYQNLRLKGFLRGWAQMKKKICFCWTSHFSFNSFIYSIFLCHLLYILSCWDKEKEFLPSEGAYDLLGCVLCTQRTHYVTDAARKIWKLAHLSLQRIPNHTLLFSSHCGLLFISQFSNSVPHLSHLSQLSSLSIPTLSNKWATSHALLPSTWNAVSLNFNVV